MVHEGLRHLHGPGNIRCHDARKQVEVLLTEVLLVGLAQDRRIVEQHVDWLSAELFGQVVDHVVIEHVEALDRKQRVFGPENSIGKLVAGGMMQDIAKFAVDLQGLGGAMIDPEVAEGAARFQAMLMRSPAVRIEGGTDQILRNIIAERVLGLPADMRADKGLPFNKIPSGN